MPGPAITPLGAGALAGVHLRVLLTGVQGGPMAVAAQSAFLASAAGYLWAEGRVGRRGRRWPVRYRAAFLSGMAAIWVAVGSGLATYDETSVTLHVVQHVLLMMVAPPLLVLGRPVMLLAQAAGRGTQVRITRVVHSAPAAVLTHPAVGAVVYFATMWAMLVDRQVYDFLIGHPVLHDAGHVVLVAAGLLYWLPLVSPETSPHRLPHPARLALLLLSMPLEALPGVWVRLEGRPIDPINTLGDTQAAGEVLLISATAVCSLWLVAVTVQWFAFAVREERRQLARGDGPVDGHPGDGVNLGCAGGS